ncbi:hypothetical protein L3Q82_013953 [Scortum barcoo]|uniref:Uncharacterized protein n=1 Tax=Scortum barcoo TaxID=214431 RepID=A0ACB8VV22_9TELE|nr:hypothetical protein L3Q82_013953 [Scortum barcoo]
MSQSDLSGTTYCSVLLRCLAGGEIFDQCVADNDEAFTEKDVIRLAKQILTGVAFLHRNNVVHLDLKPQNILLTSARPLGDIRIVDFGLSRRMDNITEVREILGTPEYVAPEILNYEPISTATDMWSIGVLTYVMLTGESPFLGDNKQETFLNISQVKHRLLAGHLRGDLPAGCRLHQVLIDQKPQDVSQVHSGTEVHPSASKKRATAEECLNHPWLNSLPHPHSHLHARSASSLDEPDASQSESEPESPAPSPELDLIGSYLMCPGQGELKTGRDAFSFSEPPFPTRPEIQQELIC